MKMNKKTIFKFVSLGLCVFLQSCQRGRAISKIIESSTQQNHRIVSTLEIKIPPQPYKNLSESPFFQDSQNLGYANFKMYTPQYPLYSDGATKRRWLYLPENTQIDTRLPDQWVFPKGSILYKEFSVNGKKIETRVMEKISEEIGFDAWRTSVYVWLSDQSDARLLTVNNFYTQSEADKQPFEAQNVADQYRMVNLNKCQSCHETAKDMVQGFSYLQLSDSAQNVNVMTLGSENYFTQAFSRFDQIPGTSADQQAIGYIQSNCATCHNDEGIGPHNFRHLSTSQTLSDEPLMQSIANVPGLVTYGDPGKSLLYLRMESKTMPRIPLYTVDTAGLQVIEKWIKQLVQAP